MKKTLKIGFDLDGVILYNPIRTFRLLAKSLKFIKPILVKQKKRPFFVPKTKLEKKLWFILHKTSLWPAQGINDLKKMVKNNSIEAYLITGRFDFLESDMYSWMKKINGKKIFKKIYFNKNNLQPNIFKEKIINDLYLDYFVEDNWDIIEKLKNKTKTKIIWISNLLDYHINYPYKFLSLKKAVDFLNQVISRF